MLLVHLSHPFQVTQLTLQVTQNGFSSDKAGLPRDTFDLPSDTAHLSSDTAGFLSDTVLFTKVLRWFKFALKLPYSILCSKLWHSSLIKWHSWLFKWHLVFPSDTVLFTMFTTVLIAYCAANYDWPFGTLPSGLFWSNLDNRYLKTYPRTYSGQFWNMLLFSRAVVNSIAL